MTNRAVVLIGIAGVAIVAVLVGTGLGWWGDGASGPALAQPLSVRTQLVPGASFFGDPVVAEVAVDLDSRIVAPSSVRVVPSFAPFVASAPVIRTSSAGRDKTIEYQYSIQCLSDGCLPAGSARSVQLPPVVVTARASARELTARAAWPPAFVSSRLGGSSAKTGSPAFRHSAPLPPPVYRVSPGGLAFALVVVGGLLGAAAVALIVFELATRTRRSRSAAAQPTQLEAALALVRDAANRRDAADRRKALEQLAEALANEGSATLAVTAEQVAWAEPPPSSERALEVADRVEQLTEVETA